MVNTISMSNSSNDRYDSFLGYFVEAPRALYCLVSDASIAKVKIENLDDISIYDYSDNVLCLEQIKYKEKFNLTNNSTDLWNTIAIWVRNVINNQNAYNNSEFRIFSVMGFVVGDFANAIFNKIIDDNSFEQEWQIIQKNFKTDSKKLQATFNFLNDNQEILKFVCIRATVKTVDKSFMEDFKKVILNRFPALEEEIDNFVKNVLGWFTEKVLDENKKLKVGTVLLQDDFINGPLFNFNRKLRYKLKEYGELDNNEVLSLQNSQMIKQMELITNNETLIQNVPKDYLIWILLCRFCNQKGIMNEDQKRSFLQDAHDDWLLKKELIDTTLEEQRQGLTLYNDCINSNFNFNIVKLSGPERTILKGILNELANININEDLSIGWHPRYREILGGNIENDI